jgi:hypothetical protein
LTALIAYWTVVCRVPRRLVEVMLADVWSLEMSLGSTQKAWEEVEQPCQQLQEQLPHEAKNKRRLIRPVTARYMHAKEVAAYEKEEGSTT